MILLEKLSLMTCTYKKIIFSIILSLTADFRYILSRFLIHQYRTKVNSTVQEIVKRPYQITLYHNKNIMSQLIYKAAQKRIFYLKMLKHSISLSCKRRI